MTDTTTHTHVPATELDRVMREQGRMGNWLAAQVGVDPATVSRWRKGHIKAAQQTMGRVAVALGRSEEDGPSLFCPPSLVTTTQETDG